MRIILKYVVWVASVKFSRILILVFCVLILIPLFAHYYLSKVEQNVRNDHHSDSTFDILDDNISMLSDKKFRIEEMRKIIASMGNELRNLELKRQHLFNEITSYHQKIDQLKLEILRKHSELNKLKISLQQAELSHIEAVRHNNPELAPPVPIVSFELPVVYIPPKNTPSCYRMHNCFDYSRCSLTSGFPVYLYNPEEYSELWHLPLQLKTLVHQVINYNPHFRNDAHSACVYLVLVGESKYLNVTLINKLPYWGGDGRNHIILNLSRNILSTSIKINISADIGKAIVAQSTWLNGELRYHHDLVIPPILGPPGGEIWIESPYMLPARRKYLLSFEGFISNTVADSLESSQLNVHLIHRFLTLTTKDKFFITFNCSGLSILDENTVNDDFKLCNTEKARSSILKESTFALVPSPINEKLISSPLFLTRLFESLKYGAIPLILGSDQVELPFNEVINWEKATVSIPISRLPECHWLLRSIPDNDLLFMRRQGRLLYDKYFATGQNILDTILAVIRNRLFIPPLPVSDMPARSVFPKNFTLLKVDPVVSEAEPEENLGPLEPPFNSLKFKRNFSVIRTQNFELWNDWGDPFHLYPYLPFDPLLPSDAKFIGSEIGFRAINNGVGGAGKEFCESLGGNVQKEQFTILMLTYEREQVLVNSLSRLHGLPYLNKIIVVWNSPSLPSADLRWPDIAIPIEVVSVRKNSLNNRFLPFENIETEAVLSVDDDAHLRHDEIIFGFRVWREQRDRIVGFPGRYHALDLNHGGWLYNSNYSCELSMVLTGAAFIHKYYLYMYTYHLPQAIRDMVDEFMNCEDIAMNFLVSHITRKPPIKVTSRWTFRCPGCPVSLSEDETHFNERHKCINFFTKVFGYTPLVNTQFRADSILFKTRIPHDKQKCFKFI